MAVLHAEDPSSKPSERRASLQRNHPASSAHMKFLARQARPGPGRRRFAGCPKAGTNSSDPVATNRELTEATGRIAAISCFKGNLGPLPKTGRPRSSAPKPLGWRPFDSVGHVWAPRSMRTERWLVALPPAEFCCRPVPTGPRSDSTYCDGSPSKTAARGDARSKCPASPIPLRASSFCSTGALTHAAGRIRTERVAASDTQLIVGVGQADSRTVASAIARKPPWLGSCQRVLLRYRSSARHRNALH